MPKSRLTPFHQSNRSIQEVTPCPAYTASPTLTARVKTYDFVWYVSKSIQNCKLYIGKWESYLIICDPSVWNFSMRPPMSPQGLGRNVHGGFWKCYCFLNQPGPAKFGMHFVPLSGLAQSAKICWSWLNRGSERDPNETWTRSERDPMDTTDTTHGQTQCSPTQPTSHTEHKAILSYHLAVVRGWWSAIVILLLWSGVSGQLL